MIVVSAMLTRLSINPLRLRCALTRVRISDARSLASSRCRKFKIVVSSGIRSKPICAKRRCGAARECGGREQDSETWLDVIHAPSVPAITELEADDRSEEHPSELQS